jgi:hypothetical protein
MRAARSWGEMEETERVEVSTEYSNELPALGRDTVYSLRIREAEIPMGGY